MTNEPLFTALHPFRAMHMGGNMQITTVLASDVADARRRIEEVLDRPGRRDYLRQWIVEGRMVKDYDGNLYVEEVN